MLRMQSAADTVRGSCNEGVMQIVVYAWHSVWSGMYRKYRRCPWLLSGRDGVPSTREKNSFMSLSFTSFGDFELMPIHCGTFRLDGGAMFGVVPKTLWSRHIPADEKNRILMGMRSLLIRSRASGRVYLIDNGAGDKFDEKMSRIYGMDLVSGNLMDSLRMAGVEPGEVTDIIFTHLHFDHCGGTTSLDAEGRLFHNFPNATYHVHERHWATATNPNAREKASFLKENIEPIADSGRLHLTGDDEVYEEGLSVQMAEGHTVGQQLPVISGPQSVKGEKQTIVYAGDLIPTHVHIPLPWVMGYDMRPLVTLREKEAFLKACVEERWLLFLEHDAETELIRVGCEDGKYFVSETLDLAEVGG